MAATDKNTKNKEIKIDWSVSDWSKCSHTCGKNGTQIRKVECVAIKGDKEQTIPKQICSDAGFKEPIKIQSCGISQCPRWFSQAWTPCYNSKCIAKRTGFQTRDVICSIGTTTDNTTVDDKYCEAVLRPRSSQTCFNRRCRGIWKTTQWSQCSVTCGVGQQYRSLECVWKYSSHESAGEACNSRRTPKKVKQCKEVPCVTTTSTPNPPMLKDESCTDTSKYCGLIVSFDMCHKDKYKRQCCMSCT